MKVTMTVSVSGTCNGKPWPDRGETVDLPDEQAQAALDAGTAVKAAKGAKVTAEPTSETPPAGIQGALADDRDATDTDGLEAEPHEHRTAVEETSTPPPAETAVGGLTTDSGPVRKSATPAPAKKTTPAKA